MWIYAAIIFILSTILAQAVGIAVYCCSGGQLATMLVATISIIIIFFFLPPPPLFLRCLLLEGVL